MNLFEFFVNLNHGNKTKNWCEAKATFTGKCQRAYSKSKAGFHANDYNIYEIKYIANGKERRGWYEFYPLEDPNPEDIKDTQMDIKYNKKKPYLFEQQ